MLPRDRLLDLLLQDSTRLLGEACFHLKASRELLEGGDEGVRAILAPDSPLIRFYRCIHAFKGMCGIMAPRLALAAELVPEFHRMEGRLAIRDYWVKARSWLPELEAALEVIQTRIQSARTTRDVARASVGPGGVAPRSVKAVSGGRSLEFPWDSVVQFIPGSQVEGRPLVPVGGRMVAVVPASGKAHDGVAFGIVVRTKAGQEIVVPVQSLELESIESLSNLVRDAAAA